MDVLDIKQLPLASKFRLCWGFFWRGVVVTISSSLCGGVLGAVAGFIVGATGAPNKAAAIAGGVLGAICGAFFLYFFLRWLLTSRIGKFRIVLTHAQQEI